MNAHAVVSPLGIETLLSRLERVHRSGKGWRCDCPNSHRARGSLSVLQGDDGRVLLHCFAGCDVADILDTLGLSMADIMPARLRDASPEGRRKAREHFKLASVNAALSVVARESCIVAIVAAEVLAGCELNADDHARVALALQRIEDARAALTP